MNNLPKQHVAGPSEARGPVPLHRFKAGPEITYVTVMKSSGVGGGGAGGASALPKVLIC